MATLVLGIAGSAIGGAVLPGGLSLLGSPLSGAAIGSTLATIGGAFIDQALLGPLAGASGQTSVPQGPRVSDLKLGTSSEGTPLPRVYGRARLPGQLIWATRFKEKKEKVKQQTAGGKNVAELDRQRQDRKDDQIHATSPTWPMPLRGSDRPHRHYLGRRQETEEGQIRIRRSSRATRMQAADC